MSEVVMILVFVLAVGNALGLVNLLLLGSDLRAERERTYEQWSNELLKRGHTNEKLCRYLEKLLGEENPNS